MDQSPPSSTGAQERTARSAIARAVVTVTACFGWLMCTLATGAVAAFAALVAGVHPSWLVLVLAIPLTLVLKICGCLRPGWAGPVAAAAVVLAAFYAICLVATARVAAATGFSFGQAFMTGGVGLVVQVGWLGLSVASVLVYAGAAVLAALVAAWIARSRRGP